MRGDRHVKHAHDRRGRRGRVRRVVRARRERGVTARRLVGNCQAEALIRIREVLDEDHKLALEVRTQRLRVLWRRDRQALRDAAAVYVLVPTPFVAGKAGRFDLSGVENALPGAEVDRRVVLPIAVRGRAHVLVGSPRGVNDRRCRGRAGGIGRRRRKSAHRLGHRPCNVDVVAEERNRSAPKHRQVGRVHLELFEGTATIPERTESVLRYPRRAERGHVARRGLRHYHLNRMPALRQPEIINERSKDGVRRRPFGLARFKEKPSLSIWPREGRHCVKKSPRVVESQIVVKHE